MHIQLPVCAFNLSIRYILYEQHTIMKSIGLNLIIIHLNLAQVQNLLSEAFVTPSHYSCILMHDKQPH